MKINQLLSCYNYMVLYQIVFSRRDEFFIAFRPLSGKQ